MIPSAPTTPFAQAPNPMAAYLSLALSLAVIVPLAGLCPEP